MPGKVGPRSTSPVHVRYHDLAALLLLRRPAGATGATRAVPWHGQAGASELRALFFGLRREAPPVFEVGMRSKGPRLEAYILKSFIQSARLYSNPVLASDMRDFVMNVLRRCRFAASSSSLEQLLERSRPC